MEQSAVHSGRAHCPKRIKAQVGLRTERLRGLSGRRSPPSVGGPACAMPSGAGRPLWAGRLNQTAPLDGKAGHTNRGGNPHVQRWIRGGGNSEPGHFARGVAVDARLGGGGGANMGPNPHLYEANCFGLYSAPRCSPALSQRATAAMCSLTCTRSLGTPPASGYVSAGGCPLVFTPPFATCSPLLVIFHLSRFSPEMKPSEIMGFRARLTIIFHRGTPWALAA